jgi:hypothetical protein
LSRGPFISKAVMAAPQRLAIQDHHFPINGPAQALGPLAEALAEPLGIEHCKNVPETSDRMIESYYF